MCWVWVTRETLLLGSHLMRSVCYDGDLNASCVLTALCDGTCPSDRQSCSPAPAPGRCLCSLLSPGLRTLTGLWAPIPRSRPPELSALAPGPGSSALLRAGNYLDWRLDDDPCAITLSKPLGAARCQKRWHIALCYAIRIYIGLDFIITEIIKLWYTTLRERALDISNVSPVKSELCLLPGSLIRMLFAMNF